MTDLGVGNAADSGHSGGVAIDRGQLEKVIEVIRPAIQADGGDISLRDVDEAAGVVSIELMGACTTCTAASVTIKAGVERILRDRVPGVTEVIDVNDLGAEDPMSESAVSL